MNCRLDAMAARMNAFEVGVWNWYCGVVNPFALEAGIVASEFREEGLRGPVRRMALAALNAIHQTFQIVAAERRKKAQE